MNDGNRTDHKEIPTPRTDALDASLNGDYPGCYAAMLEHAKRLEGDLQAATQRVEELEAGPLGVVNRKRLDAESQVSALRGELDEARDLCEAQGRPKGERLAESILGLVETADHIILPLTNERNALRGELAGAYERCAKAIRIFAGEYDQQTVEARVLTAAVHRLVLLAEKS